ncbi:hypothetical protein PILCRDRAFT_823635 [Piloderma croceum F 1598]|uniref:Uncharacterized protein n=1 Tax=Piloderma croceum (strain F 1598) TaxID=765440 RepID=A0A0C3F3L7_PILCF|nr:hypothetical protein PILCRDRAFT_823635 [Piloderma croceum F 1598]
MSCQDGRQKHSIIKAHLPEKILLWVNYISHTAYNVRCPMAAKKQELRNSPNGTCVTRAGTMIIQALAELKTEYTNIRWARF